MTTNDSTTDISGNVEAVSITLLLEMLTEELTWMIKDKWHQISAAPVRDPKIREIIMILDSLPAAVISDYIGANLVKDVFDVAVSIHLETQSSEQILGFIAANASRYSKWVKTCNLPDEKMLSPDLLDVFLERYTTAKEFWGYQSRIPFCGYYLTLLAASAFDSKELVSTYGAVFGALLHEIGSDDESDEDTEPCTKLAVLHDLLTGWDKDCLILREQLKTVTQ